MTTPGRLASEPFRMTPNAFVVTFRVVVDC